MLRLSVVACMSSVCFKSDGSRSFGIPRSQVCRRGRAKLNLSMRKNPHENAFSLLATLVKRVKTDRRPKNLIFQSHFSLLKQPFFARPRVQNPRENHFCIHTREKAKSPFRKRPYYPPPPPPHPRQVQFCRWEQHFRGPNPKKTWDPLRWRDLVVVV